jgi:formylglycine-generating enzyme required for sulfatase activity/tRNA A-37 threonylcarbamoyl transferase component Bud32
MPDVIGRLNASLDGRYRIERELGQGGMATVYLAEDLRHHRRVAIKVLRPELAAAIGAERFLQEIEVTAGLSHPHILPLFDSGEAEGLLFYVMPYIEGESLRDRLTRDGRLPVRDALAIAGDAAAGLTAAHGRGIVHRDMKPENILLAGGEGLVADFGIALALSRVDAGRLTSTGFRVGTPAYMSPEQITGESTIDPRSDVYALACVLFEMLTGEPPFAGRTPQAIMSQTIAATPRRARSLRADVPAEVDAALARALAKDPAARFATPREFIEACAPPAARYGRRNRWIAFPLLAVLLVSVVAWPLWRSQQTARARSLLPVIADLAERGRYGEAYTLAVRAERRLAGDSGLTRLLGLVSDRLTVTTEPAGAAVYLESLPDEGKATGDRVLAGRTPLTDLRIARGDHRVTVEKPGFATLERMASSALGRVERPTSMGDRIVLGLRLVPADSQPLDMVVVPGGRYTLVSPDAPLGLVADLGPYDLDRFEVTNDQYREFVQGGGYATVTGRFLDRTGLPGPRDWVNQEPPAGKGRHPVTGVSWSEAAAFCARIGKRLPTLFEWEKAARDGGASLLGVIMPWGYMSAAAHTEARANFGSGGTMPVDALPFGISPYGAYAMAGNVKEWVANPVDDGYGVVGGSWQDPAYLYSEVGAAPAATASPALGFRCARSAAGGPGDQGAGRLRVHVPPPVYRPVDPATFRTLLAFYRYDRRPANARGIQMVETADWRRERLWMDGVARDSILAYLYLPRRAAPPYQTLVYVPSSAAFFFQPVWAAIEADLAPHIKAGRAVFAVVLKGMLERPERTGFEPPPSASVRFRDLMVLHATEIRLGMDYLETRGDIDRTRLAYVGLSLGAGSRLPFAAVDDRFRSVVLIGAGIDERVQPTLPEAANFNFAPYIRPPKLVLNGRQDEEHPWNTRGLPLWNLLREPKELVLVEGAGHHPPLEQRVAPINAFLDRTLGPVATAASPK